MSEETKDVGPPGVCLIKEEFVVKDHTRSLSTEHISKDDLIKIETLSVQTNDSGSKKQKIYQTKKLKGQNKERRGGGGGGDPEWKSKVEFCPHIVDNTVPATCQRGDTCRFQHDRAAYLDGKPPDVGQECYVYRLTGRCPWGIACRFGGDHLTGEGVNIINKDVLQGDDNQRSRQQSMNTLDKETVTKLWKKKYDFTRSNASVKAAESKTRDKKRAPAPGDDNGLREQSEDTKHTDSSKDDVMLEKSGVCDDNTECLDPAREVTTEETCVAGKHQESLEIEKTSGAIDDSDLIKPKPCEKKEIDWKGLLYLSPLTTVGNMPFRRICTELGADVTCSEMALALSLLQGTREWTLVKRHPSEKIFGVQICGSNPVVMTKCAQLLEEKADVDFVDINLGCPIDALYQQGCGSGMLVRKGLLTRTVEAMSSVLLRVPLTVKLRMGVTSNTPLAHTLMPIFRSAGVSLATVHGRSREQRYTRNADWSYIRQCAVAAQPMHVFGNGDILSYEDYQRLLDLAPECSGVMIGRGALIKPWIFTEIKERRHWDISSGERFDIIKKYSNYGLHHWGSDTRGVETTRRFLLEWLSFLHRYVPVGLLERPPQAINQRPPVYRGRDDMETLMASANCSDWVKISEMLLGPVPEGFVFLPKHKSNAWK